MKVKFYHWYNFLLGALLSVVGYGCLSNGDEPVMYGSPTDNYQISGVVTDENGNPVEGIKASLNHVDVKDGNMRTILFNMSSASNSWRSGARNFRLG